MNEYNFILDGAQYSYSKLSAFYKCRYCWKRTYIDLDRGEDTAFSEYGTLLHKILELYAKQELQPFEVSQYYIDHYQEYVTHDFPPNKFKDLNELYYNAGLDYLNNLDFILDKYEILGVEKRVEFEVDGHKIVGYIDLLLKDKQTGDITVLDHKSANLKFLKNGDISSTSLEQFEGFKKQLLLYSQGVYEEYHTYPKYLSWNLFRVQKIHTVEFNKTELKEAMKWVEDTIHYIEAEEKFAPDNKNEFWCNYICSQSNCCPYKNFVSTKYQKRKAN